MKITTKKYMNEKINILIILIKSLFFVIYNKVIKNS